MTLEVYDVQRSGKAVLHWVHGDGVGELIDIFGSVDKSLTGRRQLPVKCDIDVARRLSLMRHHTATHVVNGAAKEVLGRHVWQAGAHKSAESARLDITHYEAIDDGTLKRIEKRANEIVMQDLALKKEVEDRTKAELEHGFTIYQGGYVPGKELRIVDIPGFDVEACGGTHCDRTGEIGMIKVLSAKRIQDGIVRIEFVAGEKALERIDGQERMIRDIATLIDAPEGSLVTIIKTLLDDRRRLEKRLSEASRHKAEGVLAKLLERSRTSGGIKVIFSSNEYEPEVIEEVSRDMSSVDGAIAILNPKGVGKLYVTRGKGVKLSAREVLRKVCEVAGGGGGGTDEFARGEVRDASKLKEGVEKALQVKL
jgi:alanyl-tRNA synthetase